jgi:hypothetical protein
MPVKQGETVGLAIDMFCPTPKEWRNADDRGATSASSGERGRLESVEIGEFVSQEVPLGERPYTVLI